VNPPIADVPQAPPERATLSRELADLLVELQIALHKHAIYPPDHPLVEAAVDGVVRRLRGWLAERDVLSIGVARKQLILDGVATDPDHPLLRELASRLHRHHLGAVKIGAGIPAEEVADLLATIGSEPARAAGDSLGMRTGELNERWTKARLYPLSYAQLQLAGEEESEAMRSSRVAQLWVGLAQAALALEAGAATDAPGRDGAEPLDVARAIDGHQRDVAYDQAVVGYLLQITRELGSGQGAETAGIQRRISRLVSSLSQDTLAKLLAMSGDVHQRRRFVLDAAQGMTVDAVVEVVKAAATAEQQTVSHSMLRLLGKLAQHAEADAARRRAADAALRENVARLVGEWALDDPNPEAYSMVLQGFASSAPADSGAESAPLVCEPERVLQMGLELDVDSRAVWRALDALVARGAEGIVRVLDLADAAPPDCRLARLLWGELLDRDPLRVLLAEPRPDTTAIQRVIRHQGSGAAAALLDAFEEATDPKAREQLGELVAALGHEVGSLVARRLEVVRPAAQRELLSLLGRLPTLPAELQLTDYLRSTDPLVRREALRLAVRDGEGGDPAARTRILRDALADVDPRVVFVALGAVAERCPREVLPVLLRRVEQGELDAALRAQAIRVVAMHRDPAHLPWLIARMSTAPRFLRRAKLLPRSPEVLAAVSALGAYWRQDGRARRAIELAASAADPEVRQALAHGSHRLTPLRGAVRAETRD